MNLVRSGVVVTRLAEPPLGDVVSGQRVKVRIPRLPVGLVDASIEVKPLRGGVVRSLRLALDRTASPRADDDRLERQRALDAKVDALVAEGEAIERSIAVLRGVRFPERPAPPDGVKPSASDVGARLALLAELAEATRDLVVAKTRLSAELERAEAEARSHARETEDARRKGAFEKSLELEIERVGEESCALEVSYFMRRARWAPTYVLRVDTAHAEATLELRASIAQATGESWEGVALSLATADPQRFHELPELQSLRIGRQQPARPTGFRPLTADPHVLFADYERALAARPSKRSKPQRKAELSREREERDAFDADVADQPAPEPSVLLGGMGGYGSAPPMIQPSPSMMAPMPMSAPRGFAPQSRAMVSSHPTMDLKAKLGRASVTRAPAKGGFFSLGHADLADEIDELDGGGGGASGPARTATDERVFAYESLRMPAFEERRGKLVLLERTALYRELWTSTEPLDETAFEREEQAGPSLAELPTGTHAPAADEGFHHRLEGSVRVSVAGDGQFHSVPILQLTTPVKLRHVVVPSESTDVFRRASGKNPLDVPLLAGPCDVYVDGEFLLTTDVETVGPRGELSIPMGVEQSIRVVRNTTFSEASEGLIGGTLALKHEVTIEVQNHLPRACELEVRERLPVPDEREENVRVELGPVKPAWSPMRPRGREREVKGAHAWMVELAKDARSVLQASYVVRLPSKYELEGGNRRA